MPTYEYRCELCGHTFEEFQSITAKPIRKCPKCGKLSVKRLISSGAGFIFHGSGFYQTDYRSEKYQAAAKKDSEVGQTAAATPTAAGDSQGAGGKDGQGKSAAKAKPDIANPVTSASGDSGKAAVAPKAIKSTAPKLRT
ncbi:MAG: FmdB family zinc ribbon protein [Phycisphaerae bacterium]